MVNNENDAIFINWKKFSKFQRPFAPNVEKFSGKKFELKTVQKEPGDNLMNPAFAMMYASDENSSGR